ncbi:unnamed protein product [Tilletia laevis]|nr:unnamed protein product [Tilletia laevis]
MLYNLEPSIPTTFGSADFVNATITEVTRSHRYHDHAETDGTQDIASQFAAAYDKEPEPYSHSSARRKARSRFALLKRRIYVHGLKQCTDAVSLLFTPSVYQP